MHNRVRYVNWLNSKWALIVFILIYIVSSYIITFKIANIIDKAILITIYLLFVLIIVLALFPISNAVCYNIIYLKSYKDSPSFMKRNKDKIIVGIIVAFIASLMTALISHFITTK